MVLDGGGGGGSTGRWTNWSEKDVSTMWGYLGYLNLDPLWTHSSGWSKTHELASTNLWRLKSFREKLAQAWPPEKSDAAKVYVEKLDELIQNVQDVYDASVTNKASASDIALSLGLAKGKLKPLYDEYQANAAKQSTYDQQLSAKKQELLDRYGSDKNRGYVQSIGYWQQRNPNPAVASRQQEITEQARSIMWDVSSDLGSANRRMVQPPPYIPPAGRDEKDTSSGSGWSGGGGGGSAGLIPPFIPAPVPLFPGPTPHTNGPILSGTLPPSTTLPGPSTLPPIGTPPSCVGLPSGPPNVGLPMPIPPGGVIGKLPPTGLTGVPNVIGGARPNPVGGVIGAAGGGRAGAAAGGRAVNPVGGMIGGGGRPGAAVPGGVGAAGRGGMHGGGLPLGAGARAAQRGSDETDRNWDPDNPWEVAEGVAPIVEAPSEWGPIDPGPMIGGHR